MTYKTLLVSEKIHDDYVQSLGGEIYQTSRWALVKSNWNHEYVAVKDDNDILGVALILYRKLPFTPYSLAYMPRGPVCDYSQPEHFKAILKACMKAAKRHRAFTLKFDPQISRDQHEWVKDYVKSIGGKHGGHKKGLAYNQPNFLMITDMGDDEKALEKAMGSKTRNKIRKAMKNGITTEEASLDDLDAFVKLMEITGSRDDFTTRNADYFRHILESLGSMGKLWLTTFHIKELLAIKQKEHDDLTKEAAKVQASIEKMQSGRKQEKAMRNLDSIQQRIKKAEHMIDELEAELANGREDIVLSGSIMGYFNGTAYYMYAASSNEYRELLPTYHMVWTLMSDALNNGYRYFDFGGVSGYTSDENKDDSARGLYEFKKHFASEQFETIGEFDIELRPTINKLFASGMKMRYKWRHR